jgi:TET-Associated Glycosyltransferase
VNPQFPIYIPSKSRADIATTPRFLDRIGVPYRLIVEEPQLEEYRAHFPADRILTLDPRFQDEYETLDDLEGTKSRGPGPARNFAWAHAIGEGHAWHWVMDDNIVLFARLHQNQRIPVGDGLIFAAMEDFALRYSNVGMAGPQYWMFAPSRAKLPPFVVNTRIYSCNLIRNDVNFRWRGRYNEDTILSLDLLKAGWCTVQFNAFLQDKLTTQRLDGGNTEAFYVSEGTLPKSQMLVRAHPDVARLVWRFHRWHHHVDYRPFRNMRLLKDPNYYAPKRNPYEMTRETGDRPVGIPALLGKPRGKWRH